MPFIKDEVRRLLPNVGDRRKEIMTTSEKGTRQPEDCEVVEVHRDRLWYRVKFKSGFTESYKLPKVEGDA